MLVLMAGLPGTGKTTLAHELTARTDGRVIGKDEIRYAIFSAGEIEYSTRQDDFCLEIMLQTAEYFLEKDRNRHIFLNGRTFSRCYQIENVIRAAESMRQSWRILECVCPEDIVRRRLEEQISSGSHPAGNRTFELYLEVKSRFELILQPKTVIATSHILRHCVEQALTALRS